MVPSRAAASNICSDGFYVWALAQSAQREVEKNVVEMINAVIDQAWYEISVRREWRASDARVQKFRLFMHCYSLPQRAVAIAIGYGKLFLCDQHDFKRASLEATTRISLKAKSLNAHPQLIAPNVAC